MTACRTLPGGLVENVRNSVARSVASSDRGETRARIEPSPPPPGRLDVAVAMQVIASLVWIPQAYFISMAIGMIAGGRPVGALVWPAAGVLVLGIARAMLDAAGAHRAYCVALASLSARRELAAAALATRSPLDRGRAESGRAASVITEQADAIVPYLARYKTARLRAAIVPAVMVLCVLPISWAATFALLLAAPLIPVFMALIGWHAKSESEAQLVELGGMNAFLLDRLRGLPTIRTLGAVEMTASRLRANAEDLRRRTMSVLRIAFLSSAVLEFFAALGVAMVAVYVGFHLLGQISFGVWGAPLTLEQGLFILLLAPAFFEPLRELSSVWHDRAAGLAAIDALDSISHQGRGRILGGDESDRSAPSAAEAPPGLEIRGLRFQHAGSPHLIFDDFDLDVHPGEHVAVLGPSGCGKSTLLALVAGLAVPIGGEIRIAHRRLDDESAAGLRARMAWIGQQPHIFSGTLFSNVRLGRSGVTSPDIVAALDFARLEAVRVGRGSASIGESGVGLSGGEALRLALARLAVAPHAGLILADEPTAHLDVETAREIADNLLSLARGRTLVLATHDPVLAVRMGRIIRLDDMQLGYAA